MKKKICILHANCQGDPIEELLMLSPEFSEIYEIHNFTNYTKVPIPEELISRCDLFLHQPLGEAWGKLGSALIISKLKTSAIAQPFPSLFFQYYWPLWSSAPGFDYRDSFLDSLLERELTESQILHLYINTKLPNIYDIKTILENSINRELHKEKITGINYVDLIHSNFKQERLFNTVNHPQKKLLAHLANSILTELRMNPLSGKKIEDFPQTFPDFEMPIHPQVAEYLKLTFGGPEERYHVYGADLTFEEYAMRYIKCRKHGIDDFITFLQAAALKKETSKDMI